MPANFQKMKQRPKAKPKALALKRKERQATRAFIHHNTDKFLTPRTAIKRVIDSLEDWDQGHNDIKNPGGENTP